METPLHLRFIVSLCQSVMYFIEYFFKGAMRKINLPSDFILQITVLLTYDSGQNSSSLSKPSDDEDHVNILEKIALVGHMKTSLV